MSAVSSYCLCVQCTSVYVGATANEATVLCLSLSSPAPLPSPSVAPPRDHDVPFVPFTEFHQLSVVSRSERLR